MKNGERSPNKNKNLTSREGQGTKKKKSSKRRNQKAIKRILIGFLLIMLFAVGFGAFYVLDILGNVDKEVISDSNEDLGITDETEEKLEKIDDVINIMLFGLDSRSKNESGRSDAMIILTVDGKSNKIKLTSLMRDSYVSVDGHGKDKLTHAYAYGGGQLALKTINQNFGLNIKDYVTVDFSGLEQIIDALGGVTLDITTAELESLNASILEQSTLAKKKTQYINKAGTQHVNGTQAVAYARIRSTAGGDYKRTERQRIVLESMLQEVKSAGITKFPKLVNELLPYVKTSLSTSEILKLGTAVLSTGINTIEQQRFPLDTDTKEGFIGKGWYIQFNEEATKQKLYDYIFNDINPTESAEKASTGNN